MRKKEEAVRVVRENLGDKIRFARERDPYNPQNHLDGWIDRRDYGTMVITAVNGTRCRQAIQTTPKLHYPNDKMGNFHFPKKIEAVESFEKLDGTNILQYVYNDSDNKSYVSYKTRLTMFPNEEFRMLLDKMIRKYPEIAELPFKNHCNLSYELWGYLNPITIVYDSPIELSLLFGIKHNGIVLSPTYLESGTIQKAKPYQSIRAENGFIPTEKLERMYEEEQKELEKKLVPIGEATELKDDDGIAVRTADGKKVEVHSSYKGCEGAVWYCHLDHYVQLYKLKPPTIETIHQLGSSGGSRMGKIAIKNTLLNATEDLHVLTVENVMPYLEEEYSDEEIDFFSDYISKQVRDINEQKALEREVIALYKEHNLDVNADKGRTMRFYADIYGSDRQNITKVYHVLEKYFLNEKRNK